MAQVRSQSSCATGARWPSARYSVCAVMCPFLSILRHGYRPARAARWCAPRRSRSPTWPRAARGCYTDTWPASGPRGPRPTPPAAYRYNGTAGPHPSGRAHPDLPGRNAALMGEGAAPGVLSCSRSRRPKPIWWKSGRAVWRIDPPEGARATVVAIRQPAHVLDLQLRPVARHDRTSGESTFPRPLPSAVERRRPCR